MQLANDLRTDGHPELTLPDLRQSRCIVRRTLLFTDLVGFTAWTASRGDVECYVRVAPYMAELCRMVREHRGQLIKPAGDGIQSCFPRAVDAFQCALSIHGTSVGDGEADDRGIPKTRVVLVSGECIPYRLSQYLDYFGHVVNVAARLAQYGDGSDLVVTDAFLREPEMARAIQSYRVSKELIKIRGLNGYQRIYLIRPSKRISTLRLSQSKIQIAGCASSIVHPPSEPESPELALGLRDDCEPRRYIGASSD